MSYAQSGEARSGHVHRVQLIVEVDAGDGVLTRYEVVGKPGRTMWKRTNLEVKPHYGNPGQEATQVEVHIDAMLVPVGNEMLLKITEEPLPLAALIREPSDPEPTTIVLRAVETGPSA